MGRLNVHSPSSASAGSQLAVSALAAQVDGLVLEVVDGADVADGAAAGAHQDAVRDGFLAHQLDARNERAVANAGCAEDAAVAPDEIFGMKNFAQFLFTDFLEDRAFLFFVAGPHAQKHFASEGAQGCRSENAFRRSADAVE